MLTIPVHMCTIFMFSIVQCEWKAQLVKNTPLCCYSAYVSSYTAMVCGENDKFCDKKA